MSDGLAVSTIALEGTAVGVSAELVIRCLLGKRGRVAANVRTGKCIMGLTMAVKTALFLSFYSNQGRTCKITGRISDLLYQISMSAGAFVLLARVQSVVPDNWQRRTYIFHAFLIALRFAIGVIDTALVRIENYTDGSCEYFDQEFWGPVYTIFDTLLDFYVTVVITYILVRHIKSFPTQIIKINRRLYTSVIYHNVIRTTSLTIANLISAIFIIIHSKSRYLMLLWPITNIIFVVLVGYDSDVTKAIRLIRERLDLAPSRVPSFLNQNDNTTSNDTMIQLNSTIMSVDNTVKQPVSALTDIPDIDFGLNAIPPSLRGFVDDSSSSNHNKVAFCHQEDIEKNTSSSNPAGSRVSSYSTDETCL